jgi:mono/diheme cytochrome c family protein
LSRKRIVIIAVTAIAAVCLFYADLLASAFARNPFPRSAESVARGRTLFEQHCAACHGASGHGDGPAAASLATPMDDLSDLAPPPYFPDGVVAYRIANGKNLMPAWKTLLSENEIWDLLNFIRSLPPPAKR